MPVLLRRVSLEDELSHLLYDNAIKYFGLFSLKEGFKDLRVYKDDRGRTYWCSQEANPQVDRIEIHRSDRKDATPLEVFTYIQMVEGKLYSDPPGFRVSDSLKLGFGELPRAGWFEELSYWKIGPIAIGKIREHLDRNPPISYRW